MGNIGRNQGRVLRPALRRFAKNLVDEARDVLGIDSYSKLDEALDLEEGTSQRYALYPLIRPNTRAPQAAGIQSFENRVAKVLRRPAHKVVIYNTAPLREEVVNFYTTLGLEIGEPRSEANLRDSTSADLELGYEYDWPTYSRLGKFDPS